MSRFLLLLTMLGAAFAASAENVLWIESENTMGVHRSKGAEAGNKSDRIIPVPWTRLWTSETASTNCVTMSNLVSAAELTPGEDYIKYFDTTDQVFKVWQWGGSTWGYIEDMHWKSKVESGNILSSDTTLLERGCGLWLRVKEGGDVYLIGQSTTNAAVSTMDAENPYAEDAKLFTENFVVNPCDTDVDLLPMVTHAVIGDEINVTTSTNSLLYWYRVPTGGEDAAWCTLGKTIEEREAPWNPNIKIKVEVLGYKKCATLPVPYGAGVWYSCVTNATHNPPPAIRWHHPEEFRK